MYFFDTYAMIEGGKGNPNYAQYEGKQVNASVYNKTEFFYSVLLEKGEKLATEKMNQLNISLLDVKDEDIIEACKFKLKHKAKKLSYADCIGYTLARRNNMKFLTGHNQFKGMENVEFVK